MTREILPCCLWGCGRSSWSSSGSRALVPTVIVPPHPGVTSALGCLLVDVRHDLLTTLVVETSKADTKLIEEEFVKLEKEAIQ